MHMENSKKSFGEEPNMIEELISTIHNFKTKMLFQYKDFEAAEPHLYLMGNFLGYWRNQSWVKGYRMQKVKK